MPEIYALLGSSHKDSLVFKKLILDAPLYPWRAQGKLGGRGHCPLYEPLRHHPPRPDSPYYERQPICKEEPTYPHS